MDDRGLLALDAIERSIVNAQRGGGAAAICDLSDPEILAAVETATKNLETEESGLIYEHRSASSRIDRVSRKIRGTLDEVSAKLPPESRLRRSDVTRALNYARDQVRAHIQRDGAVADGSHSYIRYITLFYPWPEDATRPLIV